VSEQSNRDVAAADPAASTHPFGSLDQALVQSTSNGEEAGDDDTIGDALAVATTSWATKRDRRELCRSLARLLVVLEDER
jgi:hypothetical protein